jgi:hypothetical protein
MAGEAARRGEYEAEVEKLVEVVIALAWRS